jgi:hypothetical protein
MTWQANTRTSRASAVSLRYGGTRAHGGESSQRHLWSVMSDEHTEALRYEASHPLTTSHAEDPTRGHGGVSETVLRYWQMLRLVPRAPRKIDSAAIERLLQDQGIEIGRRSIQRELESLSTSFPALCCDRRLAGASLAGDMLLRRAWVLHFIYRDNDGRPEELVAVACDRHRGLRLRSESPGRSA